MNPLIASPTALRDSGNPATHRAMLALAERLLAGREAHRAGLVERGEAVGEAIETSIRLARALVAQWRWVLDPAAGELPDPEWPDGWWGAWPHELAADTATAADRARHKAASGDEAAIETANQCEVLAWYQFIEYNRYVGRIVWDVDLDRMRARRGAAVRLAA